jgi:hypothetical protein
LKILYRPAVIDFVTYIRLVVDIATLPKGIREIQAIAGIIAQEVIQLHNIKIRYSLWQVIGHFTVESAVVQIAVERYVEIHKVCIVVKRCKITV